MPTIHAYHAHIYFDASTLDQARALCEEAARRFPLKWAAFMNAWWGRTRIGAAC